MSAIHVIETLGAKQERFAVALARLILKLDDLKYGVRLHEVWRTPEQAKWNADHDLGIANSLHCDGLAADLYLTRLGQLIPENVAAYQVVGDLWKKLGADHRWGGDMARRDVYHVSITHGGRL